MSSRPQPRRPFQRRAWFAAVAAAGCAGLAGAQPAPPPPAAAEPPAKASAPEEAPPVSVPTPAPLVAPPISEKEVAAAPPPDRGDAKTPSAPVRRARFDVAVLEALDKVTAESLRFEAAVGRPVRYKSLIFTVKACERSAPDEPVEDSIAYLTIDSQPRPEPGKPPLSPRQAFKGWMFASSPSLHPLEHPVYAAWLITCRAAAPPVAPPVAPTR